MPVYIRLNLGSASPEVLRFYGSKGILELSENGLSFGSQPGVDLGPSYYTGSFPENLAARTRSHGTPSTIRSQAKNRCTTASTTWATRTTTRARISGSTSRP